MSENEAQERKRVRCIRYTLNTFDVNCNKVIAYFNHALSGPVEEKDGEVFQPHLPIAVNISWRIRITARCLPPENQNREVSEVHFTIATEVGITTRGAIDSKEELYYRTVARLYEKGWCTGDRTSFYRICCIAHIGSR
jgi:hypothetical protein